MYMKKVHYVLILPKTSDGYMSIVIMLKWMDYLHDNMDKIGKVYKLDWIFGESDKDLEYYLNLKRTPEEIENTELRVRYIGVAPTEEMCKNMMPKDVRESQNMSFGVIMSDPAYQYLHEYFDRATILKEIDEKKSPSELLYDHALEYVPGMNLFR